MGGVYSYDKIKALNRKGYQGNKGAGYALQLYFQCAA